MAEPADEPGVPFGEYVRNLRRARGWGQSTLAREAGLSDGYISLIETGRRGSRPSPKTLAALAAALECDPQEIFEVAGQSMPLADIHRLQANMARPSEVIRAIERDQLLRPAERDELVKLYNNYTADRQP